MNVFDYVNCFNDDAAVYDCREGVFQKYYENMTAADFENRKSELAGEGFDCVFENDLYGNLFSVFTKNTVTVTMLYTPCDASMRVTAGENCNLPQFEKQNCNNECATTFYCFENDHSMIDCGMCLLIQCCDYSFFVVDSGHYFQVNDNDRIYKFMRERTPKGRRVVVNGWLVTHAHTDHISKLMDFLMYNCDDVEIEGFYSNLLPADYPSEWDNEETETASKLFRLLEKYPAKKYKLHTGQRFYLRNLEIDVLGTHEDIYPERITDYNDSSCVITVKAEGTKLFIPGDASALASKKLEARYGRNLKCDVAQVAHHGHFGLSPKAYELIDADLLVFPITRIKFDEEYPNVEANRRAIELADEYYISSDGTVVVPLPYRKGNVKQLPDESFEDFEKIRRLWGYEYTEERKKELFDLFVSNSGSLDRTVLPADMNGYCAVTKWRS